MRFFLKDIKRFNDHFNYGLHLLSVPNREVLLSLIQGRLLVCILLRLNYVSSLSVYDNHRRQLFFLPRAKYELPPSSPLPSPPWAPSGRGNGGHLTPLDFDIKFFPYH